MVNAPLNGGGGDDKLVRPGKSLNVGSTPIPFTNEWRKQKTHQASKTGVDIEMT